MDQFRAFPSQASRKLVAQTDEGIARYMTQRKALRHPRFRAFHRNIRQKFRGFIHTGKALQKAADIHLIAGEVAPNGVGIYGEAHADTPV